MAKQTETVQTSPALVNRFSGVIRLLELERAFVIFSIIYFPVTWLFLHHGLLASSILIVYTMIMFVVALLLLTKFVLHLASHADSHSGNYGSLFSTYIFDALIPLLMLKALGRVVDLLLPIDRHQGIVCDLVRLFRDLYYNIFNYQYTLSVVVWISLALMFVFTLWSVGKKNN